MKYADLLQFWDPYLHDEGYSVLPHLHQWRKKTDAGFQCVILSLLPVPEGQLLEVHVGLRIDAVEEMVFSFTNGLPGFRRDSLSLVTPLGKISGRFPQRWLLRKEEDWSAVGEKWNRQRMEEGVPFLQRYTSLAGLHQLLNLQLDEKCPYIHNQYYRAFRGMAVAKLTSYPALEELAEAHRLQLETLRAPDYIVQRFERLRGYLLTLSLN